MTKIEVLDLASPLSAAVICVAQINAAPSLDFLRTPPSNRLEKLRGNLVPFRSLRINDQWRIIFLWEDGDASEVRIIDYHD